MRFLPLILKNLRRSRRRTLVTAAGIGLSIFVVSALLAVEAGFETLFDTSGESVLNVYEKGVACPFNSRVLDSYAGLIGSTPRVVSATGVLRGLYSYQSKDNLVVVSGVDYDAFRSIKRVVIREGDERAFHARGDAALVGRLAASQYGWRVGQTISLVEDGLTLQVAGIFHSADRSYEQGVLVHKPFLARLKRDEGRSTYLIVAVSDPGAVAAVSKSIDGALANYPKPTTTQSERAAKEQEMKDFAEIRRMLSAMLLATIVASVFGAANSVSMSVRERTREVGILRSLGLRRAHVLQILLGESTLVAAAGGLIGLGTAAALLATERSLGGFIPLILSPKYAVLGMGIALLIGLVGALIPSLNASRLAIVESLRFVD
ncbi:MAG TPA: FtsX-like permease family protein [Vicinamibacteria bacterium]|nr:FtsX-like permease family protein [Vicinamibacteria bacterium]